MVNNMKADQKPYWFCRVYFTQQHLSYSTGVLIVVLGHVSPSTLDLQNAVPSLCITDNRNYVERVRKWEHDLIQCGNVLQNLVWMQCYCRR